MVMAEVKKRPAVVEGKETKATMHAIARDGRRGYVLTKRILIARSELQRPEQACYCCSYRECIVREMKPKTIEREGGEPQSDIQLPVVSIV